MKLKLKAGTTSKLLRVFVQDSSSTTGAGLTGVAHNAAGLCAYYICEGQSSTTEITLYSGTTGTYSSGCWNEIDATYMPGVYELGLPDAVIGSGAASTVVYVKGATNMAPCLVEIELDAVDYQSASNFGLSNLDAAVSTRSTFDHSSNEVTTDSASRTASQADVSALATASSIAALNDFNPASDTVSAVTTVATVTNAVTTDSASRTASQADVSALATASEVATIDALVDAIKSVTDNLPNSGALTDIATAAAVTTIDSVADSILVIANKLDSAMEADGLVSRFTTNALEQAPSGGGGGGDATASNQSTIITHLTDIKGSGFASTDTLEAIRDRGDSAWTTGGSGGGIYSLTVTCQDSSGNAVANVRVNIDGTTTTLVTNSSGQCVFNLDAGTYSLVASPPSEFNTPADTSVTVSADASQTITLTQASTSGSAGWVG